jgi:hypothetical protein
MDKASWDSLKPESKKVWDMLSDEEKAKILAPTRPTSTAMVLHANQHNVVTPEEDAPNDNEDASTHDPDATIDINNAVSKARGEAHPGDTRRMLGSTKKTTLKAKFAHFDYSDDDNGEWEPCDGDLVDEYWGAGSESDESDDSGTDFHRGD